MFLSDREITELCCFHNKTDENLIYPFMPRQIRHVDTGFDELNYKAVSYGLSSYGYDMRLSDTSFKVFHRIPGVVVDPKQFDDANLEHAKLQHSDNGAFFVLPAHTYALGVSMERFNLPSNITGICLGKSTYARCGVIVNITPLEAGWKGYLTIEISNSSDSDVRIYANEGIAQVLFSAGKQCRVSYADRGGKYQDQDKEITLPRM